MEKYALPRFGKRPIQTVGTADILAVLSPIWTDTHETVKRLKQRLSTVFDWAKGTGHYPHGYPVNGVKKALPNVKRRPDHMPAMDWRNVPAFMDELSHRDGVSARTLEFLILTATRSGEARGAPWGKIEGGVWTIPGERMKRGIPHRVPLSDAALQVLEKVRGLDAGFVFPNIQSDATGKSRPQSVMVFKVLLCRMGHEGITVHGIRSTFRDWCAESAHTDREVAEAAFARELGHHQNLRGDRSRVHEDRPPRARRHDGGAPTLLHAIEAISLGGKSQYPTGTPGRPGANET